MQQVKEENNKLLQGIHRFWYGTGHESAGTKYLFRNDRGSEAEHSKQSTQRTLRTGTAHSGEQSRQRHNAIMAFFLENMPGTVV
jgi:hypothetical protein